MATTGIPNGTLICIYIGGVKVSNLTTNSHSVQMATRDASTKDSAGWKAVLGGQLSWSASCEGYFAEDATYAYEDMFDSMTARTAVTVMISSAVTGDIKYSGSAYITALERTAGVEDSVQFTCSLEGTGALSKATI
jgi:TP901-1 family phage major tail protein